MTGPHPILAPALASLRDAAAWQPATPGDLASLLHTLSSLGGDNLLTALGDLLDALAEALPAVPGLSGGEHAVAASWLGAASERLAPVGDALDHARAELETEDTP